MPALPRLAAPPPPAAPSARRRSLTLRPPPPPRPSHCSSSWNSRRRSPLRPSATAAGAPREGPLPEPEELDQLLLAALRAARIRDEESRRSGIPGDFPRVVALIDFTIWARTAELRATCSTNRGETIIAHHVLPTTVILFHLVRAKPWWIACYSVLVFFIVNSFNKGIEQSGGQSYPQKVV
jgi:hypothetical protein